MISYLVDSLRQVISPGLTLCTQNWDYLDAGDAAEAFIAMTEHGDAGVVYNVANGEYRPLREYVEEVRLLLAPKVTVCYGESSHDTFWL